MPTLTTEGYPFQPTISVPATWSSPSTPWDVRAFTDIEVQFVGTPSVAYQPQRSLDGTNYVNTLAFDQSGTSYATITAAGIYSFDGGGYLQFSAGSGSTLTRRAGA